MKDYDYQYLIGKNKSEIKELIGDSFNFFPMDTWSYFIKRTWFGKKKILIILFDGETAVKIFFKWTYGKK